MAMCAGRPRCPTPTKLWLKVQAFLELGGASDIGEKERRVVEAYNRDDCHIDVASARLARNCASRAAIADGEIIERPALSDALPSQALSERQLKIAALVGRAHVRHARRSIGADGDERHARWILRPIVSTGTAANRRCPGGEYFRLCDLPAEDLLDERAGLERSQVREAVGGTAKAPVHRYRFPPQETELRGGEDVCAVGGAKLGHVEDISIGDGWVDIQKALRKDSADLPPRRAFCPQRCEYPHRSAC